MHWMLMPLRRYADFEGRSRRMEYWMFFLGYMVLFLAVGFFGGVLNGLGGANSGFSLLGLLLFLGVLALIVPSLAVQIRRFHDQDKSGWFVLFVLIPYIGPIIVLVFMCLPGTTGTNRFGPDPINPDRDVRDVFS